VAGTHHKTTRQEQSTTKIVDLSELYLLCGSENKRGKDGEFDDCWSTKQVMSRLGVSLTSAHAFISRCIEEGVCEFVGKRSQKGVDGRNIRIPVYRFKNNT